MWEEVKLECLKKKVRCESSELKRLWKHCLENESTGVISNFSLKYMQQQLKSYMYTRGKTFPWSKRTI